MDERKKDALIAKKLGYRFYYQKLFPLDKEGYSHMLIVQEGELVDGNGYHYKEVGINDIDFSKMGLGRLPTYVSASSPETDWKVIYWVQEQEQSLQTKWLDHLLQIVSEREQWTIDKEALIFYTYIGDWAKALLEVIQDVS